MFYLSYSNKIGEQWKGFWMTIFNRYILLIAFCVQTFANAVVIDEFLDEEVNCSNILDYVQSYLELSTMDHTLLSTTANRFSAKAHIFLPGAIIPDHQKPSSEDLEVFKSDIKNSVKIIQENQNVFLHKSNIINKVLPGCLK